jgi:hypothetical protein
MLSNKPSKYRECRRAAASSSFSSTPTPEELMEEDDDDATDEGKLTGVSSDAEADATNFAKPLRPAELVEETHQLTVRNLGSGSSRGETDAKRWHTSMKKRRAALEPEGGIPLAAVVEGIIRFDASTNHGQFGGGEVERGSCAFELIKSSTKSTNSSINCEQSAVLDAISEYGSNVIGQYTS